MLAIAYLIKNCCCFFFFFFFNLEIELSFWPFISKSFIPLSLSLSLMVILVVNSAPSKDLKKNYFVKNWGPSAKQRDVFIYLFIFTPTLWLAVLILDVLVHQANFLLVYLGLLNSYESLRYLHYYFSVIMRQGVYFLSYCIRTLHVCMTFFKICLPKFSCQVNFWREKGRVYRWLPGKLIRWDTGILHAK